MKKVKILFSLLSMLSYTLLVCGVGAAGTSMLCTGTFNYTPEITTGYFAMVCMLDFKMPIGYALSSPIVFNKGICRNIQQSLTDLMGTNAPAAKRTPVGYLQAITSPTNRAGLDQIQIDSKNGKKHLVDITYTQRAAGGENVVDDEVDGCTEDFSVEPFEDTIDITNVLSLKGMTFDEDQMRRLCEPDSSWMAGRLNEQLDDFMIQLNKRLIAIQNTNFGNFANGSNAVQSRQLLNVISANNKVPNAYGEVQITNDFEDIDFTGRYINIGAGKLREFTRLSEIGCCNQNGIDNGQIGDFDYFYDRHVGGILGNADDFIAIAPGNVQLLTYNKYKGDYIKKNDSFKKFTIIDPYTGLELDIRWKYDDCKERWIMTFSLRYELFFLPADAFKATDPLYGVNYTQHYRATAA